MENLFYLLLLIMGFPAGLLLAYLCKDEIKKWRKTLFVMSGVALFLIVVVSFLTFEYKLPAIISLFFIIITCLTIVWKGN
jgi:hypothetical protein